MANEEIYNEHFFAELYDWQHSWPDDYDAYISHAKGSKRILDIGCGTGIFSLALAKQGYNIVGADPAEAMLDIARKKLKNGQISWVRGDARNLSLNEEFDMVFMTGNAFQALLTRNDRMQALTNIAKHLKPGGKFFFDSRNPFGKAWEGWKRELTLKTQQHPDYGNVTFWVDAEYDDETRIASYTWTYELENGQSHSAISQIAFTPQEELAELIARAGLQADKWMKNAHGDSFDEKSPDMMILGSKQC